MGRNVVNFKELLEQINQSGTNRFEAVSETKYKGKTKPLTLKCEYCNNLITKKQARRFLEYGCPSCRNGTWLKENPLIEEKNKRKEVINSTDNSIYIKEITNFIKEHSIYEVILNDKYDIYIPEKRIGINFIMVWVDSTNPRANNQNPAHRLDHLMNLKRAEKDGDRLIQIFEWEWEKKQKIVKAKLASILNLNTNREKIYARKCKVKPIENALAKAFCDENHIQGGKNGSTRNGLFYNDELVAVITFIKSKKKQRYIDKKVYELDRYCTKLDYHVIGGMSKLLKNSINGLEADFITTFSDSRWTKRDDNMYLRTGFEKVSNSMPNYFYWRKTKEGFEIHHRYRFYKSKLREEFKDFNDSLTESENIEKLTNYNKIYDCGNILYEMKINP